METREWNNLQLELYQLLKNNSNDIKLKEVIEYYKTNVIVWKEFNNVLQRCLVDFDKGTVRGIQEHFGYLIIKFDIWDYLIIDTKTNRCLKQDEVDNVFGEKFFIDNFKEEQIGISNYWFYDCIDVVSLIDFYNRYKSILSGERVVRYEVTNEKGRIGLDYSLVKDSITLYMHGFDELMRVNYLFFDGNLNSLGVSNPTGNMEELRYIKDDIVNLSVSNEMIKDRVKVFKLD